MFLPWFKNLILFSKSKNYCLNFVFNLEYKGLVLRRTDKIYETTASVNIIRSSFFFSKKMQSTISTKVGKMGQDPYLLAWFNQADIDWLLTVSQKKTLLIGSYLIKEEEQSPSLFIIVEGVFGIETKTNNGPLNIQIGPGEILGEMSFIDNSRPSASVKALENGTVLDLDKSILDEKLNADTAFASRFFRAISAVLANRLRETLNPSGTSSKKLVPNMASFLQKNSPQV
jgi:CRP/FNR family transcriptional regulator, cyclic AMP receptor protein